MRLYKFLWDTHKWTGVVLSLLLTVIAGSGFLLLLKKRFAWIQPPSQPAAAGAVEDFLPLQEIFRRVLAHGHPAFARHEDVDRIDLRPRERLHKVQSVHSYMEMQVDAVTGEVLAVESRLSDLLEDLHDGSWFAAAYHDYVMPVVPCALLFLVGSGLYLWLQPLLRRRRNARSG